MGVVRKTKAVITVLQILEDRNEAKSVVQLIELVKSEMNKTTVYRVLDRLEKEGVIHSFNDREGLKWYAKCNCCKAHEHKDIHPHFQCTLCDKIECLSIDIQLPVMKNHKIDTAAMLLVGQCAACSS